MTDTAKSRPRKLQRIFMMAGPVLSVLAGLSLFAAEREGLLQRSSTAEMTVNLIIEDRPSGSGVTRLIESFISIDKNSGQILICPPVPVETTFQVITHFASKRSRPRSRETTRTRGASTRGVRRQNHWRSPTSRKCTAEDAIVLTDSADRDDPLFTEFRKARPLFRIFLAAE